MASGPCAAVTALPVALAETLLATASVLAAQTR